MKADKCLRSQHLPSDEGTENREPRWFQKLTKGQEELNYSDADFPGHLRLGGDI